MKLNSCDIKNKLNEEKGFGKIIKIKKVFCLNYFDQDNTLKYVYTAAFCKLFNFEVINHLPYFV